MKGIALAQCSVDGCRLTATETGMCFYHDRCPPPEITPSDAARILHDKRYKAEVKRTVTEESITLTEEPAPIIENSDPPVIDENMVPSLDGTIDKFNEKNCTAIANLRLQSGGLVCVMLDFNPLTAPLEERHFIEDITSHIQAYARKYPLADKRKFLE